MINTDQLQINFEKKKEDDKMSYIFTGLRRKNNQISDNFELISYNEKFKPKITYSEAIQCFTIKDS